MDLRPIIQSEISQKERKKQVVFQSAVFIWGDFLLTPTVET